MMTTIAEEKHASTTHGPARLAFEAIHGALAADEKTREPMNALAVWTELGRGLSGTLDQKGAEPGKLREIVRAYCRDRGAVNEASLERWAYRLDPSMRLSPTEMGRAMRRVTKALEEHLPDQTAAAGADPANDRALFLIIVRGWFPVGLDIVRALPTAHASTERERLEALATWCARFLPKDDSAPRELGVRVVKE